MFFLVKPSTERSSTLNPDLIGPVFIRKTSKDPGFGKRRSKSRTEGTRSVVQTVEKTESPRRKE